MIELTLSQSSKEIIDGIPEYIELTSSVDSDIYYTLDGTMPSASSLLADGEIYLPTGVGTVTIKAIAITESSLSPVLDYTFYTSSTDLGAPRRIGDQGVVVMLSTSEAADGLSYDLSGEAAQELRDSFDSYDIKASVTTSDGTPLSPGETSASFVNLLRKRIVSDEFSSSSVNDNIYFDPKAKVIYIDGLSEQSLENQVVKIVNRTYNSFEPTSSFYEERRHRSDPLITGNYVRSFYNSKTGKYISYYWESLESRWIVSEQTISSSTSGSYPPSRNRFVFRWVDERGSSSAIL